MADAVERVLTLRFQPDLSSVDSALAGLEQRAARVITFGASGGGGATFAAEGPAIGGGAPPTPGGTPGGSPGAGGFRPARGGDEERIWALRERTALIGADPGQRLGYWQQRAGEMGSGTLGRAKADEQVARAEQALAKAKEREAAAAERSAAAAEKAAQRRSAAVERAAARDDAGLGRQFDAIVGAAEDEQSAGLPPPLPRGFRAGGPSGGGRVAGGARIGGLRLGRLGYLTSAGFAAMEAFRLGNAGADYLQGLGEAGNDSAAQYRVAQKAQQAAFSVPLLGQAAEFITSPFRQRTESVMADAERQNKQTAEGMQDVQRTIQQRRAIQMESTPGAYGQAVHGADYRFQDQQRDINERAGQRFGNVASEMGLRQSRAQWQRVLGFVAHTGGLAGIAASFGLDERAEDQADSAGADSSHLNAVIAAQTAAAQGRNQRERDLAIANARRTIAAQTGTYDLEASVGRDRAAGGRGRDFDLRVVRRRHELQEQQASDAVTTPEEFRNIQALGRANEADEQARATENSRVSGLENYRFGTRAGVANLQSRRMGFEASVYGQFRAGNEAVAQADPSQQAAARQAANAELGKAIAEGLHTISRQNAADLGSAEVDRAIVGRDPRGAALARLRQQRDEELDAAGNGIGGLLRRPAIYARYAGGVSRTNQQYDDEQFNFRASVRARNDETSFELSSHEDPATRRLLGAARGTVNSTLLSAIRAGQQGQAGAIGDILQGGALNLQLQRRNYVQSFTPEEVDPTRTALHGSPRGDSTSDPAKVFEEIAQDIKALKDVAPDLKSLLDITRQRLGLAAP